MSTQTITARTRMMIQDTGVPFAASLVVDGISTVFDLPVESISSSTPPTVILDGSVISNQATPIYSIYYKPGVIVFSEPPPQGVTVSIQGLNYAEFDDDEVSQAVTDGFNLHVADQDPLPYIDPVLGQCGIPTNEEYLVSILAAVELLWYRATSASSDVDIHTPEGVSIPRSQRFAQISAQIQRLQEEYKTMAGALGVGLWRIQVLFQRRKSLTTNRLVPIFREQEYNAPYTGFEPTTGIPGTLITIHGRYFTGATSVTFGGVAALTFTVVDDWHIQAIVPTGGLTGQIGITTPYGVVLSTAQFVVGQPPPIEFYGPEFVKIPIPPGL